MEKNTNSLSWLHGLEEYFEYTGNQEALNYIKFILRLHYSNSPVVEITQSGDKITFISKLRHFVKDQVLDYFHKFYRQGYNPVPLQDAFSRNQVKSKIWLSEELLKVKKDLGNLALFGGWYGHHSLYLNKFDYKTIRNFDADLEACMVSDYVFNNDNLKDYKVKAIHTNIDDVVTSQTGHEYVVKNFASENSYKEKIKFDTIINTSSEHMDTNWFFELKFKKLKPTVVIQSNNLFDLPEHINCVHSINHLKKIFPMEEIYFEGEQQLQGYKRIMLIGRP